MRTDAIISRLDRVRQTGSASWIACCPAHADKSPSMTIREVEDRVLIHCFAGCPVEAILRALGMTFADLYPEPLPTTFRPLRKPFPAADVLEAISDELGVLSVVAADLRRGKELTPDVASRLAVAQSRISEARRLANG